MVGAGFDVIWLIVATEAAQKRAVFRVPITHFQVIIGTTVMSLNLRRGFRLEVDKQVMEFTKNKHDLMY